MRNPRAALLMLAPAFLFAGCTEIRVATKAPSTPLEAYERIRQGEADLKAGRLDEAIRGLESACAAEPRLASAHELLADAYFRARRGADGERACLHLLAFAPQRARAREMLAAHYLRTGRIPKAI